MRCPRGHGDLQSASGAGATTYGCPACAGRAVTVALLRRMMPAERLHELWTLVRGGEAGDAACPSCERPMRVAELGEGANALQLDGCPSCQVIWFGADELRALAPDSASPAPLLDAPVPADASDQWAWRRVLRTLSQQHYEGPSAAAALRALI